MYCYEKKFVSILIFFFIFLLIDNNAVRGVVKKSKMDKIQISEKKNKSGVKEKSKIKNGSDSVISLILKNEKHGRWNEKENLEEENIIIDKNEIDLKDSNINEVYGKKAVKEDKEVEKDKEAPHKEKFTLKLKEILTKKKQDKKAIPKIQDDVEEILTKKQAPNKEEFTNKGKEKILTKKEDDKKKIPTINEEFNKILTKKEDYKKMIPQIEDVKEINQKKEEEDKKVLPKIKEDKEILTKKEDVKQFTPIIEVEQFKEILIKKENVKQVTPTNEAEQYKESPKVQESNNPKIEDIQVNNKIPSLFDKTINNLNLSLEDFKLKLNNFLHDSFYSIKNTSDIVLSNFFIILNKFSSPDYKKVKKGDFYSELVYVKLLPAAKVSGFLFIILISLCLFAYIFIQITKFICNLFVKNAKSSSESHENSYLPIKQTINLKGRLKRTPNNINYNELFIDNNSVKDKVKKNEKSIFKELNINEDKKNENLDDFFERVKEKNNFEKIFNNNNEMNNKRAEVTKDIKINLNENLLIFDENENNKNDSNFMTSLPNYNSNKSQNNNSKIDIDETKINLIKSPLKIPIQENEEKVNESMSLEDKMKNGSIFLQTPLVNLRKNTIPKKKI